MSVMLKCALVAAVCLLSTVGKGPEPNLKTVARKVRDRYGPAVVTVRLTLKDERFNEEKRLEIAGTVVRADGLTVISNRASLDGLGWNARLEQKKVSDVRLVGPDGHESAARLVYRDADSDLALVRPVDKSRKWASVPPEGSAMPEALDDLIVLYRLGRALNKEVAIEVGRVAAVVRRPRSVVVPEANDRPGEPVFDSAGRAVGVLVVWAGAERPTRGDVRGPARRQVVLPVEAIREAIEQVGAAEKAGD